MALARAGAPLRRALARLAARLLAPDGEPRGPRGGWEALGFVRAGDYAREQLGMSAQELGDLARVDAALCALPRITEAWLAGRITWTKVRLLARAATAEDEAAWLAVALRTTAAGLARRVREVDRGCLDAQGTAPVDARAGPDAPSENEADRPLGTDTPRGLDARPDTDESGAPEETCETLRVPCPPRVSAQWGAVRRLAWRVAGERLSTADCAEAVVAEALSALLPLEVDPETVPPPRTRGGSQAGARAGAAPDADGSSEVAPPCAAPAPCPFVAALTEGLEDAGPRELDARLRRAVALERTRLARLGPLLLDLADAKAYRDLGFTSLDAYARERLGMAPRTARALLRLERAFRACRGSAPLRRAWRSGALSWSQAQTLVALALAEGSAPFVAAWLARAERVTVRRLEDDVDHALATGELDPEALPALPVPPTPIDVGDVPAGVQIGVVTTVGEGDASAAGPSPAGDRAGRDRGPAGGGGARRWRSCVRIHAPVAVVRLLRASLATLQRRIERRAGRPSSPGEALGALLDHVIEAWTTSALGPRRSIPREHRVFARDGWRCVAPGCSSYRNLHAHHVRFRSAGGGDALSNLTTLCAAHHQRGVHAGHLRIRGRAPARLRFEMPLGAWRSGDRRA